MSGMYEVVRSYLSIYQSSAAHAWSNLTPQQYATILILVAFVGWLSMRGGPR